MKLYDFGLTIGIIIFLLAIGYFTVVVGEEKLEGPLPIVTNVHP
jgi:hypothetical protein